MLPLRRMLQLHTILCYFLTLTLAEQDVWYNPASNFRPRNVTGLSDFYRFVGSYYNATAEVELKTEIGSWYGQDGRGEGPMCYKHKNYTAVFKYDAILSVIDRGFWNDGTNAINFWLALLPETSPAFDISSVDDNFFWSTNMSIPIFTVDPGYLWSPREGSIPDTFNFTTNQAPTGAYNFSVTIPAGIGSQPSKFGNTTLPVCNASYLTSDYRMHMVFEATRTIAGWPGFRHPHVTAQFDDKTANMTLDGVFVAIPYVQPDQISEENLGLGDPTVFGYITVRFSGVLDPYHSDSLSLDGKAPSWVRTVGWNNDSSNVGYNDTVDSDENEAGKLRLGHSTGLIAIVLLTKMLF